MLVFVIIGLTTSFIVSCYYPSILENKFIFNWKNETNKLKKSIY